MARAVYCAYIDCRSRSDRRGFGVPRPVLLDYCTFLPHLLKPIHDQMLCNRHRWKLETALREARCTAQLQSDAFMEASGPALRGDDVIAIPPSSSPPLSSPSSPPPPPSTDALTGASSRGRRTVSTMMSMGWHMSAAIRAELFRLMTAHHRLTANTWNGSSDHLEASADADISIANGEMQQQPYCDLIHTLMTHGNLPADCKMQGTSASSHFFLDIGSGYGLAALRARILSGVAVVGGVEVARDRTFISHRLADAVQLRDYVHFIDANATSPDVLPILRAATHLFAYSAVYSRATRSYLAQEVIFCEDSNWLVYVTFDKVDVLKDAGIKVNHGSHEPHCTEGGVHWVGHTSSLSMSVSGQKMQANIFVRCTRPDAASGQHRFVAGAALLRSMAAASRQRGEEYMNNLMTSNKAETRASVKRRRMI
jgi:hypothetical protein